MNRLLSFRQPASLGIPVMGARQHYLEMRRRNPWNSDPVWFGILCLLCLMLGLTALGTGALWP